MKPTVERFRGPMARSVSTAKCSWHEREGLLLRLTDPEGRVGLGEASPLPGYSADDIDRAEAELRSIPDPEQMTSPSARFALETALLDLEGQRRGLSIAELLGREPPRRVPLCALVDSLAEAGRAVAIGVNHLKLKIGMDLDAELALLAELRRSFPGVVIRLDAAGKLASEDLLRLTGAEFVEEPLSGAALAALRGAPFPVAADESLQDEELQPALVAASQVLVLKPMALGGLSRCLGLARSARHAGRACVVSHMFDGPVALAACAELAAALPCRQLAAGLWPHAGLAAWPQVDIPQLDGATCGSAGRPGLGLTL